MKPVHLHDKNEMETFLRRNVFLNIYAIGDLDDFFWPYTTWYGFKEGDRIRQIALFYTGTSMPTLLAVTEERIDEMRDLLAAIIPLLPGRFYAHLSEGLSEPFRDRYAIDSNGIHYKMGLADPSRCECVDTRDVVPLTLSDHDELVELYNTSYPGHWFERRMLETGYYYGLREEGRLISVSGVHVYSETYRVAALGNITTHPDHRGSGLATRATAGLCQALLQTVDYIGLNVKTDNADAIACYRKLGFKPITTYEECSFK